MKVIGTKKTYVEVNADTDTAGRQHPLHIVWRDGRKLPVRVRSVTPAASLKAGGAGIRYTVDISGHQTYLFQEDTGDDAPLSRFRWFVEEKIWAEG
jgi:hypothetical protein